MRPNELESLRNRMLLQESQFYCFLFLFFCFCLFLFCFVFLSHAFVLFWSTTVQSFLSEDGRKQFKEGSCCRHVFQNTRVKLIPWRAIFTWCSTWQSVATVTLFTRRRPFEFVNEESPAVTNGDVKGKRTALASVLAAVVTEIDRSFHCAFSYCGCTIKPTRKLSPALRNPLLVRCTALFSSQDTVEAWLLLLKKNAGFLKTLAPNRPLPSNECHRHRYHCRYRNYYHFFIITIRWFMQEAVCVCYSITLYMSLSCSCAPSCTGCLFIWLVSCCCRCCCSFKGMPRASPLNFHEPCVLPLGPHQLD